MHAREKRDAREAAVQFLVHCDLNGRALDADLGEDQTLFWKMRGALRRVRQLANHLGREVLARRAELDERIQRHSQNYVLARMNSVDRNILRLATYEMFHRLEVPPVVAINEAIDIAKRYGTEESGAFVNGLLDRIKAEVQRPLREAIAPDPFDRAPDAGEMETGETGSDAGAKVSLGAAQPSAREGHAAAARPPALPRQASPGHEQGGARRKIATPEGPLSVEELF